MVAIYLMSCRCVQLGRQGLAFEPAVTIAEIISHLPMLAGRQTTTIARSVRRASIPIWIYAAAKRLYGQEGQRRS